MLLKTSCTMDFQDIYVFMKIQFKPFLVRLVVCGNTQKICKPASNSSHVKIILDWYHLRILDKNLNKFRTRSHYLVRVDDEPCISTEMDFASNCTKVHIIQKNAMIWALLIILLFRCDFERDRKCFNSVWLKMHVSNMHVQIIKIKFEYELSFTAYRHKQVIDSRT